MAVLFALGIVTAQYLPSSLFWLLAGILTLCLLVFLGLEQRDIGHTFYDRSLHTLFYLFLIILAGLVRQSAEDRIRSMEKERSSWVELFAGEEIGITGQIVETGDRSSGGQYWVVLVRETEIGGRRWQGGYRIRLYADRPDTDRNHEADFTDEDLQDPEPRLHDLVELRVELLRLDEVRNPGQFDYREWLARRGIYLHGSVNRITGIEKNRNPRLSTRISWRVKLLNRVEERFQVSSEIARGILLGDRSRLKEVDQKAFSRSGIAHLMAVSGLHVGFMITPFWFLLRRSGRSRPGLRSLLVLSAGYLFAYAAVTDFSPSVTRASLMAWLFLVAIASEKTRHTLNLLGASALLLLLINPELLFDIGFQLSYAAVIGIVVFCPPINRWIEQRVKNAWAYRILVLFNVSLVVQFTLAPLLIYYFGEISLIAPVLNLLVLPFVSLLVPAGMVLIMVPESWMNILEPVRSLMDGGMDMIRQSARFASGFSWAWTDPDFDVGPALLLWLFAVLSLAGGTYRTFRLTLIRSTAFLLWVLTLLEFQEIRQPARMEITFLDVGQGDAIHIKTPKGKHVLVDTGVWTPWSNSAERVLIPYFEKIGLKRLDALVLTHPHADHIGGAPDLLEKIPVDRIYHCGSAEESGVFRRYRKVAAEQGIEKQAVSKGDLILIDPSIRILVMGPSPDSSVGDINNRSVVAKLVYHHTSLLLTGDAERQQEERIGRVYGSLLDADLLKAAHHGSRTSSTHGFLRRVDPVHTVVSSGYRNRYDHPHREAVRRLADHSMNLHFTGLEGGIRFSSDGESFVRVR